MGEGGRDMFAHPYCLWPVSQKVGDPLAEKQAEGLKVEGEYEGNSGVKCQVIDKQDFHIIPFFHHSGGSGIRGVCIVCSSSSSSSSVSPRHSDWDDMQTVGCWVMKN